MQLFKMILRWIDRSIVNSDTYSNGHLEGTHDGPVHLVCPGDTEYTSSASGAPNTHQMVFTVGQTAELVGNLCYIHLKALCLIGSLHWTFR
jgi:hypothetical protein